MPTAGGEHWPTAKFELLLPDGAGAGLLDQPQAAAACGIKLGTTFDTSTPIRRYTRAERPMAAIAGCACRCRAFS